MESKSTVQGVKSCIKFFCFATFGDLKTVTKRNSGEFFKYSAGKLVLKPNYFETVKCLVPF